MRLSDAQRSHICLTQHFFYLFLVCKISISVWANETLSPITSFGKVYIFLLLLFKFHSLKQIVCTFEMILFTCGNFHFQTFEYNVDGFAPQSSVWISLCNITCAVWMEMSMRSELMNVCTCPMSMHAWLFTTNAVSCIFCYFFKA